jgi:hypothetical protein
VDAGSRAESDRAHDAERGKMTRTDRHDFAADKSSAPEQRFTPERLREQFCDGDHKQTGDGRPWPAKTGVNAYDSILYVNSCFRARAGPSKWQVSGRAWNAPSPRRDVRAPGRRPRAAPHCWLAAGGRPAKAPTIDLPARRPRPRHRDRPSGRPGRSRSNPALVRGAAWGKTQHQTGYRPVNGQ